MEINGQETNPNSETLNQLTQLQGGEVSIDTTLKSPVGAGGTSTPEPVAEPAPADPAPETVTYDGKDFANEAEAFKYMQDKAANAETENLILQARQEGLEAGLQPQAPVAPVPEPEQDDDLFYADPKTYMAKERERMRTEIMSEVGQVNEDQRIWNEFYAASPDLVGFETDCQQMLDLHKVEIGLLAKKDRPAAMKFLAQKTRAKFQSYTERNKPRTDLPNNAAGASTNTNSGVTQQQNTTKEQEPLDFVSEMKSQYRG